MFQDFGLGVRPVTKKFKEPLYTKTIRLIPLTWFHLPCIRLAFLGEQWSKYGAVEPAAFEMVYYKLSSCTKPLGIWEGRPHAKRIIVIGSRNPRLQNVHFSSNIFNALENPEKRRMGVIFP